MFYTSFYEANSILHRNCLFSLGSRFRMKQGRATPNLEQCKQELKSLLMKVKEESKKVSLKLNIQKMKIRASGPIMANRWGNSGNNVRLYFLGAPKSLQMVTATMKLKDAYSLEEKL